MVSWAGVWKRTAPILRGTFVGCAAEWSSFEFQDVRGDEPYCFASLGWAHTSIGFLCCILFDSKCHSLDANEDGTLQCPFGVIRYWILLWGQIVYMMSIGYRHTVRSWGKILYFHTIGNDSWYNEILFFGCAVLNKKVDSTQSSPTIRILGWDVIQDSILSQIESWRRSHPSTNTLQLDD